MVEPGTRIRLGYMPDDPDPVPVGTLGTVEWATRMTFERRPTWQIGVKWDNGRTLMLVSPPDSFSVVKED